MKGRDGVDRDWKLRVKGMVVYCMSGDLCQLLNILRLGGVDASNYEVVY